MEKIHNHWAYGMVDLRLPPLLKEWYNDRGPMFQRCIFDPEIGEEVFLLILERPEYGGFPISAPEEIAIKPVFINTSYGAIIYLIWTVTCKSYNTTYEHFLNPYDAEAREILRDGSRQNFLKVITMDSVSSKVVAFNELSNVFIDKRFIELCNEIGQGQTGNFKLAQEEFKRDYKLEDFC